MSKTEVSIVGDQFHINGTPTYPGITWRGHRIEGLLMNARLVQGIFDDLNPETRGQWAYPDTGLWDPDRNTREFLKSMITWRNHGMLAFTINLQGGSPTGYASLGRAGVINSAIRPDGSLREDYMARLTLILDEADALGMVVILGIFYFGQELLLNKDETAIRRAVDNTLGWLFARDYRHVMIEINNECDFYQSPILAPDRVHELIEQVHGQTHMGRRFLVGTSYAGGSLPGANVMRTSDFVLLHGNGVENPARIAEMVDSVRAMPGYRTIPILFNEDDHFDFDQPMNNMVAAISRYASWGYFDYRFPGETFTDGYQSVPVDWGIDAPRKKAFFSLLSEIAGIARDSGVAGKTGK